MSGLIAIWTLGSLVSLVAGLSRNFESTLVSLEYSRAAFGSWIDSDGDCLNTRAEILLERSLTRPVFDKSGCRVIGGSWHDTYTGEVILDPKRIDVDHLVPLHFAWMAGASEWPEAERVAFMNDPSNLVLTAASINRSKGDGTPLDWLPPDNAARCAFVRTFLSVVAEYGLTLSEKSLILDSERRECS